MENTFSRCSRGVFAVWTPAELSTSHFSVLEPDSTISCEYDQTFTTDKSSLQMMETTMSEASFNMKPDSSTKFFEGCRRGMFALGPQILDPGNEDGGQVTKSFYPNGSPRTPKRRERHLTSSTRREPILHREMTAAEAWESGKCRRGVFADAVRELWEPRVFGSVNDETPNHSFKSRSNFNAHIQTRGNDL